jgi:hypothetical protein
MTSAATLTTHDAALKQHYVKERVQNLVYKDNPFLAMVPKYESFGGRNLPIPVVYGNPQGRSKNFSAAKTGSQATTSKLEDFLLTRVKDYSLATIDGEAMKASKGDANAFMDVATTEIDGALQSLTRSVAMGLFRDVSASIGQVSAEPSTNASTFTVTMKYASDIANIEVGQLINIYSAASGGSKRSSDGTDDEWYVASVNRSAGTFVVTGTYDGSGDIAANDYIFVEGDRGNGISGLEGWVPASAPSATLFFGVDRSVDTVRLGGNRLDASALPIEEALIEGEAQVAREGMSLTHYFLNNKKFGDLKKALGSKVQYVDVSVNAHVSFRGVQVEGERGTITVIPDHNCPQNRIFGVNMNYVKLYSIGPAVGLLEDDSLSMLRQSDDDGYEVRCGFYGNLGIRAPSAFINIQV